MPFKENEEGETHFCSHTKDGTICKKCLGKSQEIKKEECTCGKATPPLNKSRIKLLGHYVNCPIADLPRPKASEMFEGENSSLRKTYDEATLVSDCCGSTMRESEYSNPFLCNLCNSYCQPKQLQDILIHKLSKPQEKEKILIEYAGIWHYCDCDFPTSDQAVCNCPKGLKPTDYPLPKDVLSPKDGTICDKCLGKPKEPVIKKPLITEKEECKILEHEWVDEIIKCKKCGLISYHSFLSSNNLETKESAKIEGYIDFSTWLNYGEKYEFDKFLKDKLRREIIEEYKKEFVKDLEGMKVSEIGISEGGSELFNQAIDQVISYINKK